MAIEQQNRWRARSIALAFAAATIAPIGAHADDQGGMVEGFETLGVGLLGAVTVASSLVALWSIGLNGSAIAEGQRPPSDNNPWLGIGAGSTALGLGAVFLFHPDWQEPALGGIAMGVGAVGIGVALWALQSPEKQNGFAMPFVAPDGDGSAVLGLSVGPIPF